MKGMNEFLALSIVISLSIAAIVISIEFVKPIIEKSSDNLVINEAISNFEIISNAIDQITSEGPGSKRSIEIRVTNGFYFFDDKAESLNFTYMAKSDIALSGSKNGLNVTTENGKVRIFEKFENVDFENNHYFGPGTNIINIRYDSFENGIAKISIST